MFTPNKNDQTFSIFLRAPKILSRDVTYYVWLELFEHRRSAVYRWTVARDGNGNASIQKPEAGAKIEIVYSVAQRLGVQRKDENGLIQEEFRIVFESRTFTMAIPDGFQFGIDQQHNGESILDVVKALN